MITKCPALRLAMTSVGAIMVISLGYSAFIISKTSDGRRSADSAPTGTFIKGDGLANCVLLLSEKGTFDLSCSHVDDSDRHRYGGYYYITSEMQVHLNQQNTHEQVNPQSLLFTLVTWGEREYLIESFHLNKFCSDVNIGSEPRKGNLGRWFIRNGDENKTTSGIPHLPNTFADCVISDSIESHIVSIEDDYVVIDSGEQAGVRSGLSFFAVDRKGFYDQLDSEIVVFAVDKTQSRAKKRSDRAYTIGEHMSTKLFTKPPGLNVKLPDSISSERINKL